MPKPLLVMELPNKRLLLLLFDQIFMLSSYKNEKQIPYLFFFPTFEAYKSARLHFRPGTIPSKTGDWR